MLCPACKDVNLAMTDRQGIEIDYCPSCRGIWLDRGELDRLIERAELAAPAPIQGGAPFKRDYPPHHGSYQHHEHRPKRRKSLLGELFDF
jgi:uncharacterized protein